MQVFINSLKVLLTRLMYLAHAFITVWRVTEVIGYWYWTVALWLISLFIETGIVVFKRGGKEWKW